MRRLTLIAGVILLIALAVLPATAQDMTMTTSMTFNGFSFSYPLDVANHVTIVQFPGDSVDAAYPGGPQPPHTQFILSTGAVDPEASYAAPVVIRVYNTAAVTPFTMHQTEVDALRTLLAERSDLSSFMSVDAPEEIGGESLPFLPLYPAAQEIRARAEYVDFGDFAGIAYVTSYGQDASPILSSELRYTFQGLSADGSTYVSFVALITTPLVPSEIPADFDYDAFVTNIASAFSETINTLNGAVTTDFTPSLDALQSIVRSFSVTTPGDGTLPPAPTVTPPVEATPTAIVNTDPSLGGLVGVWTLVSFGAADAQTPVLPEAPVTIGFAETGVSGSNGCNTYSGSFTYDNGALTFTPLVQTLIACAEPVGAQESAYMTALQSATRYTISGDTLTLNYDGGTLTFTKASA